ncbi:MAG: hypothetical protein HY002_14895 [Candidatus Rokubacteria bacterium]|nr:hypothetical protein [Candidatus Rokubacteria bacterium]
MLRRGMHEPAAAERRDPLRRLWEGWRRVGRTVGDCQARVLLTLLYFVIVAPFALVVRLATDPLALKPGTPRGWHARPAPAGDPIERARRQF